MPCGGVQRVDKPSAEFILSRNGGRIHSYPGTYGSPLLSGHPAKRFRQARNVCVSPPALPRRSVFTGDALMPALQEPVATGIDTTVLLSALTALKKGNFSVRLPLEW